jgi:hypothetical protein
MRVSVATQRATKNDLASHVKDAVKGKMATVADRAPKRSSRAVQYVASPDATTCSIP